MSFARVANIHYKEDLRSNNRTMRCFYDGIVTIPHIEYITFRECLEEIPIRRREAKFRGSIRDCWGARATILYDAKTDEFYERASKRKVLDKSTVPKNRCDPFTGLGLTGPVQDEEFISTMNRLQEQNRTGNHRSRMRKVKVRQQYPGSAF